MDLKRHSKILRDKAKNKYEKGTECYICGEKAELDFHHFYSLSPLVHNYVKEQVTSRNILSFREDFIQEHWAELYEHTVTLCHVHHLKLHKVWKRSSSNNCKKQEIRRDSKRKTWHGMIVFRKNS